MSYSLSIIDGDLDIETGLFQRVSGIEKLTQDLSLWLREPYGRDRFHPLYGSILDQYIGSVISAISEHEIKAEVVRVLTAYQQIQYASMRANPAKYERDELLDTVVSVSVKLSYDYVFVNVRFRTANNEIGQVTGTVSV